jgi:hypothetical protein
MSNELGQESEKTLSVHMRQEVVGDELQEVGQGCCILLVILKVVQAVQKMLANRFRSCGYLRPC